MMAKQFAIYILVVKKKKKNYGVQKIALKLTKNKLRNFYCFYLKKKKKTLRSHDERLNTFQTVSGHCEGCVLDFVGVVSHTIK